MSRHSRIGLLSLFLVVTSFTPLRIISIVGLLILWAMYFPFPKAINSLLFRLALSFMLFTSALQLTGVLTWLSHIPLSTPLIVISQLLLFFVVYSLWGKQNHTKLILFSSHDLYALSIAIVTVFVIAFGVFGRGPALDGLLRYMVSGFDNTAHMSLSVSLYQEQGYLYGKEHDVEKKLLFKGFSAYPMGWHLSNAVWWRALPIQPVKIVEPQVSLLLYFSSVLCWFGLTIFLFCRTLLQLVSGLSASSKFSPHAAGISSVVVTLLMEAVLLLGLLRGGFSSFIPVFAYLLSLIVFMFTVFGDTTVKKDSQSIKVFIMFALVISGGLSFTWLLAAPIGYASLFIALLWLFDGSLASLLRWLIKQPSLVLTSLILLAIGASQGIFQVAFSTTPDHINQTGAIIAVNVAALLVFLTLSLIGCFCFKQLANNSFTATFLAFGTSSFLLAGFVYLYQSMTAGKITYFSIKVSLISLLVSMLFGGVVFVYGALTNLREYGLLITSGAVLSLAAIFIVGSQTDLQYAKFALGGNRTLTAQTASLLSAHINDGSFTHANVLVIKQQVFEEDIITTLLIHNLSRTDGLCTQDAVDGLLESYSPAVFRATLLQCSHSGNAPFYVITSDKTDSNLRQLVVASPTSPVIINSN